MKQSTFFLNRFGNRNGVTWWRVSGFLHGVRIRKNFKTREEAAGEEASLELKAMQAAAGMRSANTYLRESQLREAEDAFGRLDGRSRSLLVYLDYALANYPEARRDVLLSDAVGEYMSVRRVECEKMLLSPVSPNSERSPTRMASRSSTPHQLVVK